MLTFEMMAVSLLILSEGSSLASTIVVVAAAVVFVVAWTMNSIHLLSPLRMPGW